MGRPDGGRRATGKSRIVAVARPAAPAPDRLTTSGGAPILPAYIAKNGL